MEENCSMTLEEAVSKAVWCHNTNTTVKGYAPLQLLTGRAVTIPGITNGNVATESPISESEAVRRHIDNQRKINEKYREVEYGEKLRVALNTRNAAFNDYLYNQGEKVFYQHKGGKQWFGPASVAQMEGRNVWILANGEMKKVASCHVKPYGPLRTTSPRNSVVEIESNPPLKIEKVEEKQGISKENSDFREVTAKNKTNN